MSASFRLWISLMEANLWILLACLSLACAAAVLIISHAEMASMRRANRSGAWSFILARNTSGVLNTAQSPSGLHRRILDYLRRPVRSSAEHGSRSTMCGCRGDRSRQAPEPVEPTGTMAGCASREPPQIFAALPSVDAKRKLSWQLVPVPRLFSQPPRLKLQSCLANQLPWWAH
jgi:hypothetical protein